MFSTINQYWIVKPEATTVAAGQKAAPRIFILFATPRAHSVRTSIRNNTRDIITFYSIDVFYELLQLPKHIPDNCFISIIPCIPFGIETRWIWCPKSCFLPMHSQCLWLYSVLLVLDCESMNVGFTWMMN